MLDPVASTHERGSRQRGEVEESMSEGQESQKRAQARERREVHEAQESKERAQARERVRAAQERERQEQRPSSRCLGGRPGVIAAPSTR